MVSHYKNIIKGLNMFIKRLYVGLSLFGSMVYIIHIHGAEQVNIQEKIIIKNIHNDINNAIAIEQKLKAELARLVQKGISHADLHQANVLIDRLGALLTQIARDTVQEEKKEDAHAQLSKVLSQFNKVRAEIIAIIPSLNSLGKTFTSGVKQQVRSVTEKAKDIKGRMEGFAKQAKATPVDVKEANKLLTEYWDIRNTLYGVANVKPPLPPRPQAQKEVKPPLPPRPQAAEVKRKAAPKEEGFMSMLRTGLKSKFGAQRALAEEEPLESGISLKDITKIAPKEEKKIPISPEALVKGFESKFKKQQGAVPLAEEESSEAWGE